jgi:asparagine N-glycosylation enzyme membrane subunit Stt3
VNAKGISALFCAAWALTFGVAAYLRCSNLLASIVGDEIAANGPDSAYHARRMLETWAHYPHVPRLDPLLDWPHGAATPWPPGFDLLVATMALVAPNRFGALLVISAAPVLLGLLLIALTGWVTRVLAPQAPWWTPWLAGTLVALFPQAVSVARFANPDHHIAEALILPLLGLWSVWGWRALSGKQLDPRQRLRFEAVGALLVAGSVAVFVGATMYVGIVSVSLVIANLCWGRGAVARWAVGAPGLMAGAAAIAVVYQPLVSAHGRPLSYSFPSFLQPLLVLGAAIACIAASSCGWIAVGGLRRRSLGLALGALALGGASFLLRANAASLELVHGLREWFSSSGGPFAQLSENQPLFSAAPGTSAWARAHLYYGVFGPLLPLLVPVGLLLYTRREGLRRAVPFVVWTLSITLLMLQQNRFGRIGLVNLAVCTALILRVLVEQAPRFRGAARAVACAVPALALGFDPAFHFYLPLERSAALPDMQEAGAFLRAQTPRPIAGKRSGVLAPWDEAHFIVRYGERPVTATGFGAYVAPDVVNEVHRIWADDEAHLLSFARARDLGFVALSASTFTGRTLHGLGPTLPSRNGTTLWNQDYFLRAPLVTLLLGGSGVASIGVPHMQHLMPRFASSLPPSGLPAKLPGAWVYEIVPGATLRGHAPANAVVHLRTVMSLRGHQSVHEAWTQAGSDGMFALTTPVPTAYRGEGLETAATASLRIGSGPVRHVTLTEANVRRGDTLLVEPGNEE